MSFLDDAFQSFQGVTHDTTNAFGDASSTISDATTAFTDIKNIFSSPTGRTNSPPYNDPTLQSGPGSGSNQYSPPSYGDGLIGPPTLTDYVSKLVGNPNAQTPGNPKTQSSGNSNVFLLIAAAIGLYFLIR